jgi:hypothetical protein
MYLEEVLFGNDVPVPNNRNDAQPMQYGSTIMSDVPGRGNTCRQRVNVNDV